MTGLKFGLKLWSSNRNLIALAKRAVLDGVFQYVELMVVPGTDPSDFKKAGIPFILHATSENWDFNIADVDRGQSNLAIIKNCLDWADELEVKYVIVHPGFGEFAPAKNFLDKMNDSRILIENMPKVGMGGEKMVGYEPGQIKQLAERFGFCLDLNHAIKAAVSLKKNYKELILEFFKLNPKVIHISDGSFKSEKDDHLDIGKGDFDFYFFAECIKKNRVNYISLETPKTDLNSIKGDIDNLKNLKNLIGSDCLSLNLSVKTV